MGSFSARIQRIAGHFGGVYATKVLAALTRHPKSSLSRYAYRVLFDPKALNPESLNTALEGFQEADRVSSISEWPLEFWEALHRIVERNAHELPQDMIDALAPDREEGVSERVVEELYQFLAVMEREGLRGDSGVKVWSEPERIARTKLGQIATVMSRLPPVWKSYVRNHITWSVTFHTDPHENEAIVKAAFRAKIPEKFGIVLSREQSLEIHNSEDVRSTEGLFRPEDLSIHLYPRAYAGTIAHEIGHAIWDRALTPRILKKFLEDYLDRKVMKATVKDTRREWLVEDVESFFRNFKRALYGLRQRETRTWVNEMKAAWGKNYADETKGTAMIREIGNLYMSYDDKKRCIDAVVEDNKHLFTTWNEAWAEGFAETLLFVVPALEVPGAITSLIREILAMGQLP